MRYSTPLLGGGEAAKSSSILTSYQGYCRAVGPVVELNCPGLYDGPPLSWKGAMKMAVEGLRECKAAKATGSLVRIRFPKREFRAGPPEQLELLFQKMLNAAFQAKANANLEARITRGAQ